MNFKDLKEFIRIAKEEGATELKFEAKDFKASVSFQVSSSTEHALTLAQINSSKTSESPLAEVAGTKENLYEVKSPFVGTFYACSAPGKPPYVNVGDRVTPGKTMCILEAMKIMNEIEADIAGEIVEICVDNESLVEYGQTLFKIRP